MNLEALRSRPATRSDAPDIAHIYNQGIEDRVATFETRPRSAEEFVRATPIQRRKLSVKPGITCLWQVSGRNEIGDFDDWVRLDLDYIGKWTLWLDLQILLRTIPVVVRGTGAY